MERSHYCVDRSLYGDEVVARAAHRYTGIYDVEMRMEGNSLVVAFSSKDNAAVAPDFMLSFLVIYSMSFCVRWSGMKRKACSRN
ncbi:hypothetical protein LN475_12800 [Xanthomonas vesicatoria]|uniref:Uncharacterized protein n=1 Tax=Xanthomonas vesicatoria ATCC 35937 TaxID=925775 RepID=F0BFV5_9XANT|nr:hypothetical protein [Xanthomonas vesicatoria]EGD08637.1 hypothetical protein XVE_3119 [Xanthomonas vesicatoria ATCC 35937]MCC8597532.1 hypothetical protein [Xanthomonas vesicatoria]MCC8606495.1 hypothetical protein [Xanthomonas vesicatoria]